MQLAGDIIFFPLKKKLKWLAFILDNNMLNDFKIEQTWNK